MEAIVFFGGLLVLGFLIVPGLMALIALIQIQSLKREIVSLSDELYSLRSSQRELPPPAQPAPRQAPALAPMTIGRAPTPSPSSQPQPSPSQPPLAKDSPQLPDPILAVDELAPGAVTAPMLALEPQAQPQAPSTQARAADESQQAAAPAPAQVEVEAPQTQASPLEPDLGAAPQPVEEPVLDEPFNQEEASPDLLHLFNELDLGGKLTGFIGIGLLLIGVAFMIGYAVNQGWIGPLGRVMMGVGFGVFLLGLAERLERSQRRLIKPLVRILSGGGMAVLYLCTFAAFGLYKLIPELVAALLLFASAMLTFGLARRYRSEVMAFVGLIGAFLTPLALIGGGVSLPFVLSYIALINLPLLGFAISQSWHVLYNVSGLLTGLLMLILTAEHAAQDRMFVLGFGVVSSIQFMLLGLLRMRSERPKGYESFDLLRLSVVCGGALTFFHLLLYRDASILSSALFGFMALSGVGFAVALRARENKVDGEASIFFVSMMVTLMLALRSILDGSWLTLAWSIQGLALCALGLKLRIPISRLLGLFLGLVAMLKGMTVDVVSSSQEPWLELRFPVNLWAVAALAIQGELTRRLTGEDAPPWQARALTIFAILGLGVTLSLELMIKVSDLNHLLLSMLWGIEGVIFCALALSWRSTNVRALGFLIGGIVMLKTLTVDASLSQNDPFLNIRFIFSAGVIGLFAVQAILTHGAAKHQGDKALSASGQWLLLWAQLGTMMLVTTELVSISDDKGLPLITVWWGLNAFALVGVGLFKDVRLGRRAGLLLIGVTTLKLLFFDTAELEGIARILSFMGVGVLLLLLSYLYQRTQGLRVPERDLPADD